MKFFVIKKKFLICFVAFLVAIICVASVFATISANVPDSKFTIVIDAGHGGKDGGAIGKTTGITENEINLEYAEMLKEICENIGIKVVMTRSDLNGLYSPLASNKKKSDMQKRQEIIEQSGADLVVSVHMNAFPLSSSRGAQVFYGLNNDRGQVLASKIQESLHLSIEHAKAVAKEGDFFILNCTSLPGALVEFGFLSNAEEESLLVSEDYKYEMCLAVAHGILEFYEM